VVDGGEISRIFMWNFKGKQVKQVMIFAEFSKCPPHIDIPISVNQSESDKKPKPKDCQKYEKVHCFEGYFYIYDVVR
jgi:hypothetical protein